MYFRLGKSRETIVPLREAVKLRPEFFGSNALLGASYLAVGEADRALRPLRQAHALNPDDGEVVHLLYSAATRMATNLINQQKLSEGVAVLQEAVTLSPDQPEAHNLL